MAQHVLQGGDDLRCSVNGGAERVQTHAETVDYLLEVKRFAARSEDLSRAKAKV